MCLQNTLTCIVCLSVDPGSVLDYVASGGGLIEQLERIWKEAFVACSRYYPGICLERLKKTRDRLCRRASGNSLLDFTNMFSNL